MVRDLATGKSRLALQSMYQSIERFVDPLGDKMSSGFTRLSLTRLLDPELEVENEDPGGSKTLDKILSSPSLSRCVIQDLFALNNALITAVCEIDSQQTKVNEDNYKLESILRKTICELDHKRQQLETRVREEKDLLRSLEQENVTCQQETAQLRWKLNLARRHLASAAQLE